MTTSTSGLAYPVARVSRIERRPGEPFARIEAEPTAALNRDREVLLVWQGGEEDEALVDGVPDRQEPTP